MSTPRPNILLVITDQHRADHLGCYGNSVVRTPHIDALAREASVFERFYVASPVCMANRATLLTGRMPSLHGVRHNGIPLSTDATTFVEMLREFGYSTALIGKSHLQNMGYDAPNRRRWTNANGGDAPPGELLDADRRSLQGRDYDNEWTPYWEQDPDYQVQTPFYGFDHVELCTFHGDHVGGDYARWLERQYPGSNALRGRENALSDDRYSAPQAWRTRMPEELYPSTYIADRACVWLDEHAAQEDAQPFFLKCSFPDPHHPYTPPGQYWDMYDPQTIPLPRSFHARDTTPLVRAVEQDTQRGVNSREGYTPFTVTPRECQEITALTYGMISLIDHNVGRIVRHLEERGLADNTIIVFTSDHGDWMGDHGLMLKGPLHYQGLIRVPFIWRDVASRREPARRHDLGGTLDIAASILDRVGIAGYNGLQGRSLLRESAASDTERAMVVESEQVMYRFGLPDRFRVRSLVDGRYRISLSDVDGLGELYDLADDPDELHNLWSSPDHQALRLRLTERMAREMIRLTDDAPLPTALA